MAVTPNLPLFRSKMERRRYFARGQEAPQQNKKKWRPKLSREQKFWALFCLISWLLVPLLTGIIGSDSVGYKNPSCLETPRKGELFFPTIKLGCWLGARVGEPFYGPEEKEASLRN